jgi:lipopolysaccharide biosynthesis regulator YciM
LLNALFNLVLAHEGADAAAQLIREELVRSPTLLGLDKLLEAQLLAAPAERRNDLELVKGLVSQHIKRLGMYRCEQCGFRAKQYYWRCPGCNKWETYTPRRTETPDGFV